MSVWQHKGFEIAIDGATFATTIDGRPVRSSSFNAAKKAIDKHLDAKAREVALNLPVVLVKERDGEVDVQHGVITGLDATTLRVVGENLDSLHGYGRASAMPDSEENIKLYREYIAAEKAYEDAKSACFDRMIDVHFNTYGRSKKTHAEAVQVLQQSYKHACNP